MTKPVVAVEIGWLAFLNVKRLNHKFEYTTFKFHLQFAYLYLNMHNVNEYVHYVNIT